MATHRVIIGVDLDFAKLLSRENIPGLKIAYGVEEDNELIEAISNRLYNDIKAHTLAYNSGLNAELTTGEVVSLTDEEEKKDSEPVELEEYVEQREENDNEHSIETSVDSDEEYDSEEELSNEALEPTEDIDSKLINIMEDLNDHVFKLKSLAKTEIRVRMRDYAEYGQRVGEALEVETEPMTQDSLTSLSDDEVNEVAYIISYNDGGTYKRIKRLYNELNTNKEEN